METIRCARADKRVAIEKCIKHRRYGDSSGEISPLCEGCEGMKIPIPGASESKYLCNRIKEHINDIQCQHYLEMCLLNNESESIICHVCEHHQKNYMAVKKSDQKTGDDPGQQSENTSNIHNSEPAEIKKKSQHKTGECISCHGTKKIAAKGLCWSCYENQKPEKKKRYKKNPVRECVNCHKEKIIIGRGCCGVCYHKLKKTGDLPGKVKRGKLAKEKDDSTSILPICPHCGTGNESHGADCPTLKDSENEPSKNEKKSQSFKIDFIGEDHKILEFLETEAKEQRRTLDNHILFILDNHKNSKEI